MREGAGCKYMCAVLGVLCLAIMLPFYVLAAEQITATEGEFVSLPAAEGCLVEVSDHTVAEPCSGGVIALSVGSAVITVTDTRAGVSYVYELMVLPLPDQVFYEDQVYEEVPYVQPYIEDIRPYGQENHGEYSGEGQTGGGQRTDGQQIGGGQIVSNGQADGPQTSDQEAENLTQAADRGTSGETNTSSNKQADEGLTAGDEQAEREPAGSGQAGDGQTGKIQACLPPSFLIPDTATGSPGGAAGGADKQVSFEIVSAICLGPEEKKGFMSPAASQVRREIWEIQLRFPTPPRGIVSVLADGFPSSWRCEGSELVIRAALVPAEKHTLQALLTVKCGDNSRRFRVLDCSFS